MSQFPEFRQKLGEGYFNLDLPKKVDKVEVDKALREYRNLRARVAGESVISDVGHNYTIKGSGS